MDGLIFSNLTNAGLMPDAPMPVISNDRVFRIWSELYGRSPQQSLETVIALRDDAFSDS